MEYVLHTRTLNKNKLTDALIPRTLFWPRCIHGTWV